MSLAMSNQPDVHRRSIRPTTPDTRRPHASIRVRVLAATGVVAAGVLVAALIADRALWPYAAALVMIGVATVLVVNRDPAATPAQSTHIEVVGERRTAAVLKPLADAGWTIRQGIRRHRFNVDFMLDQVVIGPGGPFVIATKTVTGMVRVDRGLVSITRPGADLPDFPSDQWAYQARSIAAEAYQMLKDETGTATPVRAVVVIWGTFPQRCVSGHNVTFVHGEELTAWLLAQASRMSA